MVVAGEMGQLNSDVPQVALWIYGTATVAENVPNSAG